MRVGIGGQLAANRTRGFRGDVVYLESSDVLQHVIPDKDRVQLIFTDGAGRGRFILDAQWSIFARMLQSVDFTLQKEIADQAGTARN